MAETQKIINYTFFHWGPFLYKTSLEQKEIEKIKNLCSKELKEYANNLAGLVKHEHQIDEKKLFPIISPYIQSYTKAYLDYGTDPIGNKIKLEAAWVNYMTKFESNPLHTHSNDLSFVIYTQIAEELKKEIKETASNSKPGVINFVNTLGIKKYNVNQHTFIPEVGDLFIFPASLHHSVNHFQSEGERVSVSGNLIITNG
jgi:uncharacterized protein (TIGR02466 family)|tara:strand:+ start:42 stop:641 length:600 start_codon:yes stop_codon:yes gene_type:complete